MKMLIMIFFTIFLNANCTIDEQEASTLYFSQANQELSVKRQIALLKRSLQSCFAYEVEFYLFKLQAQEAEVVKKKIELYDKALESLSRIENKEEQVLVEQNKINKLLAKLYATRDIGISEIYTNKIRKEESHIKKSFFRQYGVYLIGVLLMGWVLLALYK